MNLSGKLVEALDNCAASLETMLAHFGARTSFEDNMQREHVLAEARAAQAAYEAAAKGDLWQPDTDEPEALRDGWCVFLVDRPYCKYEIQKVDDPESLGYTVRNVFPSDDAAFAYVWEQALQGSSLHRKAILAVWNGRTE